MMTPTAASTPPSVNQRRRWEACCPRRLFLFRSFDGRWLAALGFGTGWRFGVGAAEAPDGWGVACLVSGDDAVVWRVAEGEDAFGVECLEEGGCFFAEALWCCFPPCRVDELWGTGLPDGDLSDDGCDVGG